jgi:hypothetical protein
MPGAGPAFLRQSPARLVTQRYEGQLSDASIRASRYSGRRERSPRALFPEKGRIAASNCPSYLTCPWHPQNRIRKTTS